MKDFYHIRAWQPSWSSDKHPILIPLYLKAQIQNLIKNDPVVSENSNFNFHM